MSPADPPALLESNAGLSGGRDRNTATSDRLIPISDPLVVSERFRLLQKLGRGGMATVYRAFDEALGYEVALKAISLGRPDDLYRLKREFRLLSDVQHPNLIRLHELVVERESAFLTMELLNGKDFCRFVQTSPATRAPRRRNASSSCDCELLRHAARQLASALAAVHAQGVLHRDVKPSNVLVTTAGRVVLFDFGLAASMSSATGKTKSEGVLLGTRGYIAPEQARGEALCSAADWYGFGITLFEAATHRMPFDDGFKPFFADRDAEIYCHISRYLPDAPADLDDLIARLLHPAPGQRPREDEITSVLESLHGTRRRSRVACMPSVPARPHVEELDRFAEVLDGLQQGRSAIIHVRGASGVDGTEVARRCVEQAERRGALVLQSRCREAETIGFNAVDEIIDQLSHVLAHMPHDDFVSTLPPDADALPALFPVLGRLDTATDILVRSSERREATEARARRALKELLATLAEKRPLVLWMDAVERCDRESAELLEYLLSPPDCSPVLVVLSYGANATEPANIGLLELSLDIDSYDVTVEQVTTPNVARARRSTSGADVLSKTDCDDMRSEAL